MDKYPKETNIIKSLIGLKEMSEIKEDSLLANFAGEKLRMGDVKGALARVKENSSKGESLSSEDKSPGKKIKENLESISKLEKGNKKLGKQEEEKAVKSQKEKDEKKEEKEKKKKPPTYDELSRGQNWKEWGDENVKVKVGDVTLKEDKERKRPDAAPRPRMKLPEPEKEEKGEKKETKDEEDEEVEYVDLGGEPAKNPKEFIGLVETSWDPEIGDMKIFKTSISKNGFPVYKDYVKEMDSNSSAPYMVEEFAVPYLAGVKTGVEGVEASLIKDKIKVIESIAPKLGTMSAAVESSSKNNESLIAEAKSVMLTTRDSISSLEMIQKEMFHELTSRIEASHRDMHGLIGEVHRHIEDGSGVTRGVPIEAVRLLMEYSIAIGRFAEKKKIKLSHVINFKAAEDALIDHVTSGSITNARDAVAYIKSLIEEAERQSLREDERLGVM